MMTFLFYIYFSRYLPRYVFVYAQRKLEEVHLLVMHFTIYQIILQSLSNYFTMWGGLLKSTSLG